MKKKVGIIKRIFALLLLFLLSINSFAAVVSDNDGSAFITKAEFDSLKNNFQAQIDNYNNSIDNKIDGAIAQYLAGIQVSPWVEPLNFWENARNLIGSPLKHRKTLENTETDDLIASVVLSGTLQIYKHLWTGWKYVCRFMWNQSGTVGNTYSTVVLLVGDAYNPGYMVNNPQYVAAVGYGYKQAPSTVTYSDRIFFPIWTWDGNWIQYSTYTIEQQEVNHGSTLVEKTENEEFSFSHSVASNSRKVYRCEKLLNGNYKLKYYSDVSLKNEMVAWAHTYSDTWWPKDEAMSSAKLKPYCTENGRSLAGINLAVTQPTITTFGPQPSAGTKYIDGANSGLFLETNVNLYDNSDFNDISAIQFASAPTSSSTINCISTLPYITPTTAQDFEHNDSKWTDTWFKCGFGETTQTNDGPKITISYSDLKCEKFGLDFSTIEHEPITSVYGQNVFLGQGQPLLRFNTSDISYNFNIKFACVNASGTAVSGSCNYIISDAPFTNGSIDASHILKQGTANNGSTVTLSLTPAEDDEMWIHLTPAATTYDCTVSDLSYTHS